MKRSEAARYARWSAAVALLLASITAAVYLDRAWEARRERHDAPPPAPVDVTRQSNALTFSKVEGNRTVFTVEASRSTDFKDTVESLLEDVRITIFGKNGERHDVIHTRSCQFNKSEGRITCSGDVQLDLESAAEAARVAANPAIDPRRVHVETRGVTFNRSTGEGFSDEPVTFAFPGGSGEAVGVRYNSADGVARLLRSVRLHMVALGPRSEIPAAAGLNKSVTVTGSSLEFLRDSRTLRLPGPARAQTAAETLDAQEFTLQLSETFHPQELTASGGRPELTIRRAPGAEAALSADKLSARIAPEGWVTQIEASGSVSGTRRDSKGRDTFAAQSASLDLWPRLGQPRELNLRGAVLLQTFAADSAESSTVKTDALVLTFTQPAPGQSSTPLLAKTLAPGTVDWTEPGDSSAGTELRSDQLALDFSPGGKPSRLRATGRVQTRRSIAGGVPQIADADSAVAGLEAGGGWSRIGLAGAVHLQQGNRDARADSALFVRATRTATLSGHAVVRDAATETHARQIVFVQTSGEIRAQGGVRTTDSQSRGASFLSQGPLNIASDNLSANSRSGEALYSGHARLWQADSVLEAGSIELLRDARGLNARNDVRAVFPQAPAPGAAAPSSAGKLVLWHISADSLSYREKDARAHLEKNVLVESAGQRMRAGVLDLYFTRGAASGAPASAGQQISRALGDGGVAIEQGSRRATAERGEYVASDGKFVMSGGSPTIYDGTSGTTTGRQLTFFLTSDTIIVDSENGSRTLTKHRVAN